MGQHDGVGFGMGQIEATAESFSLESSSGTFAMVPLPNITVKSGSCIRKSPFGSRWIRRLNRAAVIG